MAQFKAYPKYKDSGVEWLGEVPEHWKISNIKRSTYLKGRVGWKGLTSNEFEVNSFAYLVTGTDFKQKYVNWSSCYQINESRYEDDPYIQLKNGDLLMTKDGTIGKLAIVKNLNKSACLNSGIFLIRPEKYYLTEFMYWVLNSNAFNLFFVMNTIGSTILHLYQNVFERFVFSYPNFKEQERIVSYLNLETAKIDALIAKQEKLIELLEEQRKSVISHAVTKGLDPNAPMKNSGIEWLGEVPAHWDITYIKYITKKISSGKTPLGGAEVYTDEGIIFLRSQNIYNNGLHLDDVSFISHEIHASMKSSAVKKNDVLLNITGGSIGRTCLVDCEIGEANVNQHVCIIRASKEKYSKWISVFMKSNSAQSQIFYSQTGAGREGLNFSQIGNMRLPFPSLNEQQEILNFLEKEDLRFDNLISKQNLLIKKLKEYRASVISHAVTGKIDVRELGA